MAYDYKKGKKRIDEILANEIKIEESEKIPSIESNKFTFDNGYYSWVTAIFVDIRNSSELFSEKGLDNKKKTAKIVRAFTSETIDILNDSENLREIGIRGDCVYAIYTTPQKPDVKDCADLAVCVNTYLHMLNKCLINDGEIALKAGIGMASAQELVVKAGRNHTGINSKVWIGEAVSRASNLSGLGDTEEIPERLCFSSTSHHNFIGIYKKENPESEQWFTPREDNTGDTYYSARIVKSEFIDWINDGMQ